MRLEIVDVFAERRFEGNQLAVVRDAVAVTDDDMQAIAREMNFSETTFVVDEAPRAPRVRIFTPVRELPFAGHPTLGTAWVLADGAGEITLDLNVGPVAVRFADGVAWMVPPDVRYHGELEAEVAAALVSVALGNIDLAYPPTFVDIGPKFVLIGVRDLEVLKRAACV